jgi:hypothetical protein
MCVRAYICYFHDHYRDVLFWISVCRVAVDILLGTATLEEVV